MRQPARYGLILAGGRGTRFWPRSRAACAKQVLRFLSERSLIQETVDRLKPVIPPQRLWIITSEVLRKEIVRQLPEVPAGQILAEPAPRNTAPCIGLAARILETIDPQAVFGVFPADHVISQPAAYRKLLPAAFAEAAKGNIAVIGIKPRWAETGYGYIEFPKGTESGEAPKAVPVLRFREKPDAALARRFVKAGHFYWNAGMFFWKASVVMEAMRKFQPATAALLEALPPVGSKRFAEALRKTFPLCQSISIDYAVLEHARNITGIPASDIGWNDVGSWDAVYELLPKDAQANATRQTDAMFETSAGNYVEAHGKLVALLGVRDLIVVDTPDALLIASRDRAQEVSNLVKRLEREGRKELL